jgi:hypothetical protein
LLDEALWCERVAVEGGGLDECDDVLWERKERGILLRKVTSSPWLWRVEPGE